MIEETTYDNWDGGTHGHDVQLFLPMEELSRVDIDDLDNVARSICEDLNKVSIGLQNEYFANVRLELYDEDDENCQRSKPFHSKTGS